MSRLKLLTSSVSLLALALASMGIYSACATTSTHGLSTLRTTGPCTLFPPDNWWRQDISKLPVHPMSAKYVDSIGPAKGLHPDFGTVWNGAPNGIPFRVVSARTPRVKIVFTRYGNESDPGPYPMPLDSPIEGGPKGTADRHVIAFDPGACKLYEIFKAYPKKDHWEARSGAIWDLRSNKLRPLGFTSADAAGLPIYPGLVRYEEVMSGEIKHALRFTVERSQRAFIIPATHWASDNTDEPLPPMGLRFRLKASFDISGFSKTNQVILRALKKYGMFMADNGGDWFLSGAPNPKWNDDDLHQLKLKVHGSDFEAVKTGPTETRVPSLDDFNAP